MAKVKKITKVSNTKPKSIGPKFWGVLFICLLMICSLIGNLLFLDTVRKEMKISFDYETRSAVETLVSSIDTYYEFDSSSTAKTLALKMVDNATWNDGRRHFWASNEDYTEMLAGEKDSEEFYSAVHQETKFGFVVLAGYDEAYFDEYAYPETKAYVVISAAIVLVVGLFALGTCTIAFHRSSRK